jgi:lipid-A-disaccharide synthase
MRLFFVAGERSGDLHASNLLRALHLLHPTVQAEAVGGEYLQEAGAELVRHYSTMAIMGFGEVLLKAPMLLRTLRETTQYIQRTKPHAVILVDYGGFNMRLAYRLVGSGIPVIYYITPKIWAWNTSRAFRLKKTTNLLLVILPFETAFFAQYGMKAVFVGNPVLDAVENHKRDYSFRSRHQIPSQVPIVAVLPGSRKQEVLALMQLIPSLCVLFPDVQWIVAAVDNLPASVYALPTSCQSVQIIQGATYDIVSEASAAIVTSGTATLETALLGTPQVVVYRTSRLSYLIAKAVIKVKFISLVNLIAGKEVVKELIQDNCTVVRIAEEVKEILHDSPKRERQLQEIKELKNSMQPAGASQRAAEAVLAFLASKE